MKRMILVFLLTAPFFMAAQADDEQTLYQLLYDDGGVVNTAATPSDASAGNDNPEWLHLIQARWGETRSLSDMVLLQEIREAVTTDIEKTVQKSLRENKPVVSADIDNIITYYAGIYHVPRNIIYEIIYEESRFNPGATSPKGAKGLMQLMDFNSKPHHIDPYDPESSIRVGTAIFARLLNKYQDVRLALAAYNAGEGAVNKYGGIPPYRETINYVNRIAARLNNEKP